MSTSTPLSATAVTQNSARPEDIATLFVVCLGPWYENSSAEQLSPLLRRMHDAFGDRASRAVVAYPASDPQAATWQHEGITLQPYMPTATLHALSVQTATTYLSLYEVMRAHSAPCGLLLGADADTLQASALRAMVQTVLEAGADLALARYSVGRNEALINASILHPLSRALFGVRARFPLALDLAMSNRMAERMATAAQRLTAASQPEAFVWPAAEAAVASYSVAEVEVGARDLPHPAADDLSLILNTIAASLFSDIEVKAAYWQRARPPLPLLSVDGAQTGNVAEQPVPPDELSELIESFRIGYGNLHEIWSLVLPPQTLLGLKRLSTTPDERFALPDALWVRIVYDFVLAHRLRTINRGHLMGSFAPLYLAWVASHILAASSADATESLARAFEADKPYLVSRWRWPDRFNP